MLTAIVRSTLGTLVGTVGLFLVFYFLGTAPLTSIRIVTLTTVGVVGALAFVRHVLLFHSDAERLG